MTTERGIELGAGAPMHLVNCGVEFFIDDEDPRIIGADIYAPDGTLIDCIESVIRRSAEVTIEWCMANYSTMHLALQIRLWMREAEIKKEAAIPALLDPFFSPELANTIRGLVDIVLIRMTCAGTPSEAAASLLALQAITRIENDDQLSALHDFIADARKTRGPKMTADKNETERATLRAQLREALMRRLYGDERYERHVEAEARRRRAPLNLRPRRQGDAA